MNIKANKNSTFAVIEKNPAGNITSEIEIPPNKWKTYKLNHTTRDNSTNINFYLNPQNADIIIYIDNAELNIH